MIKKCDKLPPLKGITNPKFGTVFSPHILTVNVGANGFGEVKPEIVPYQKLPFAPSSVVFHYGQAIFEGMKAFRQENGRVGIFRTDLHAERFAKSCEIMSMPRMPESLFVELLHAYVNFEQESVPGEPDHALYLRPFMIGTDEKIKMGRSENYSFMIISSIAGNYFQGGNVKAARVYVGRQFVRAYPGGLGEAKTAANYAASLGPLAFAASQNCDQILYLDAMKRDNIDELGGMNFFMVKNGELVTPALSGTILHGVTRKSILELGKSLGFKTKEEPISFSQLRKDIASGAVTECFACGTAAVVQPIGEFLYQDSLGASLEPIRLPETYTTGLKIAAELKAVQRGKNPQFTKWIDLV